MIKVFVAKGDNPYYITITALSKLNFPNLSNRKVLIKPNAARLFEAKAGATTNPNVVAATIDFLREIGARKLAIGESPIIGINVMEAFDITGISKVAKEKNVPLLDFDNNPYKTIPIPNGRLIDKIKVTSFIEEYDYIISIPVMKTHMHTGVTLSIKNMKGMLWRRQKIVFHQIQAPKEITNGEKELDIAIADMAKVIYPDLVIIDGTIGMEGMGPSGGEPKNAKMVIASKDALSADIVAAKLMGIEPFSIPHIRIVAKNRGFNKNNIVVSPFDYLKWKIDFAPPPKKISFSYPNVEIFDIQSCSACLSTIFLFLKRYYNEIEPYIKKDGKLNIAIGKGVKDCPKGTIYVGNCSCNTKEVVDGIKVTGCPPVASQIWEKLKSRYKKG